MTKEKLTETFVDMYMKTPDMEKLIGLVERMRRKMNKGLLDISESDFYEVRSTILNESILDPIQNERSDKVFDKDGKMLVSTKKFILDIFNEWKSGLDFEFEVEYIKMIGSMTGYQYADISDLDINVKTNLDDKQIWDARKILPNGNNLPGTNHPVNFWIGGTKDKYKKKYAENIYNVLEDKWEKQSKKKDIDVPIGYVLEVAKFFMDGFDLAISEYQRDKNDFYIFAEFNPDKQNISPEEKNEAISKKIGENS